MTSFTIKIIAVLTMTLDHAATAIGQKGFMELFGLSLHSAYLLIRWMHWLGRIAFPLFAFQIAEGARHTRSMPKYIGRLALFALISEPVYYSALGILTPSLSGFLESLAGLNFGNVFFTLALGTAAIYGWQRLTSRGGKSLWLQWLPLGILAVLAGGAVGCDYGMLGVALVIGMYFAKNKSQKCGVILVWALCLYVLQYLMYAGMPDSWELFFLNTGDFFFAAAACVPVAWYNGQRGRSVKWAFYAYYPAHLLALAILRALVRGN